MKNKKNDEEPHRQRYGARKRRVWHTCVHGCLRAAGLFSRLLFHLPQMLFKIIPLNALATAFTRYDGDTLDGDTSAGWDIVDSFHAPLADPSYSTKMHIDTGYGGGGGTGFPNYFSGGEHSTACLGPALCPSCAARGPTHRALLAFPRASGSGLCAWCTLARPVG